MVNIFTFILLIVFLFELLVLQQRIKWGGQFWSGINLKLKDIGKGFDVLENASVGSYFSMQLNKGSHKLFILKNQDSSEWWFEILINPKRKIYLTNKKKLLSRSYADIFEELLKKNGYNNFSNVSLPSNCPASFKKYRRFVLNADKEKIINLLILYFQKNYKATTNVKIYLSFYNTYVEKGLE